MTKKEQEGFTTYTTCTGPDGRWVGHHVELVRDKDGVLIKFPDHDDIEKDALISTMRGDDPAFRGCISTFIEATGGDAHGLSEILAREASEAGPASNKIQILLEAGADPNHKSWDGGETALHAAARRGYRNIKPLLEGGARVDATDGRGKTPLFYAARAGRVMALRMLLKAGADPDARDQFNQNALHEAVKSGAGYKSIGPLIEAGADPTATDSLGLRKKGFTPLHCAAAANNDNAIRALLEKGVDPDIRGLRMNTPLHIAASNDNWFPITLLVQVGGANPYLKNRNGLTPLDVAKKREKMDIGGNEQVIMALKSAMRRHDQLKEEG